MNTKVARSIFNHYALSVIHPQQKFVMNLKEDLVQLNHYKLSCLSAQLTLEQCRDTFLSSKVQDTRFRTRFGSQVIKQRQKVLLKLGMLPGAVKN